ncbi:MAG: putative cobaltochelatase [Deltaproteobacteria bacterium]|jgi:magnesium chelatase subunit D|nr:putative cobaltochelatase [Deltaproteobacteria bacterium]
MERLFPFSAIEGQERLKEALLINAVNPLAGGVLARGEKGTAKSTAARALSELLPPVRMFQGCPWGCDPDRPEELCPSCGELLDRNARQVETRAPFRTLPLNATEDRVAGGLDFEKALRTGERACEPGLLASAHRGILYIDEVNLLDDHIVDIILDAAGSGWNVLEREGVSHAHPARFILVGTMNPEEGELRPQFLDRFGLSVAVAGVADPADRVRLMLLREEFDSDPIAFRAKYQKDNDAIRDKILDARRILPSVNIPKRLRKFIASVCQENNVAGHRADLFMAEAARAAAALAGLFEVDEDTVLRVSPMVLAHRQRETAPPPPPPPPEPEEPEDNQEEQEDNQDGDQEENQDGREDQGQQERQPPPPQEARDDRPRPEPKEEDRQDEPKGDPSAGEETVFGIGDTFRVRKIESQKDRLKRRGSGRRSRSRASQKQGRYVKSGPDRGTGDVALDATIRAAAPYQVTRERAPGMAVSLKPSDIRECVREKKIGNFLFFMVDASGSMGARGRMAASKGAVMSLLLDAYQKRDQVALVSFRRNEATVNLPLTTSVDLAGRMLAELPVGGRTPLSAGLAAVFREARNALLKNPMARPIAILITDGRGNVPLDATDPSRKPFEESLRLARAMALETRVKYLVVDTEEPGIITFGLAERLAQALGAEYFRTADLKAGTLVDIVKGSMGPQGGGP